LGTSAIACKQAVAQKILTNDALESQEARIVPVEQGDIRQIQNVLKVFDRGSLAFQTVEDLNLIALYGPAATVDAAAEVIAQLDKPAREEVAANIVLTVDILTNVKDLGGPLRENAAAAAEQVRKEFAVEDLFLMDRILMRAREGSGAQGNGFIPLGGDQPSTYTFQVQHASIDADSGERLISAYDLVVGGELQFPEPEKEEETPDQTSRPRPVRAMRPGRNRYSVGMKSENLLLKPGVPLVTTKQNLMPGEALYFVVTARIEE
jgi:hypothetical protein